MKTQPMIMEKFQIQFKKKYFEIDKICQEFNVPIAAASLQFCYANDLISTMIETDAWIIVAPEYNGSVPPTLNNAIAWMSMDWQNFRTMCTGKPVGLATHSGGGGAHVILSLIHI